MAVLHVDIAIPWDVFATSPPSEAEHINYYDSMIDETLKRWFNAFKQYFETMEVKYLAPSPLNGTRNSIALYRTDGSEVEIADPCPTFIWTEDDSGNHFFVKVVSSIESQQFWLNKIFSTAHTYSMEFVVYSFFEDYPTLGTWLVTEAGWDSFLYSTLNT